MTSLENINFKVDPQMLLEIVERDMGILGLDEPQKLYQSYRGQLKLAVYVNHGLLTIHVMEGQNITAKDHSTCNTYVKLSLVPDASKRTTCKTRTIKGTNNPVFDEKFSFELLEKDLKKRLLVSVFSIDKSKGKTDLGCMSFGINNIKTEQKKVNDWYYLLAPEIGRYKHLQVVPGRTNLDNVSMASSQSTLRPSYAPYPNRMDTFNICLHRRGSSTVVIGGVVSNSINGSSGGYGFSLTGSGPVHVCRVDPDSAAAAAGLQLNDRIVRVDGQNVSGANSNAVGRIIKHTQQRVVLEVQRARGGESTPIIRLDQSPRLPRRSHVTLADVRPAPLPPAPSSYSSYSSYSSLTSVTSQFRRPQTISYYEDESPAVYTKRARLS